MNLTRRITVPAVIGAVYAVLTLLLAEISFGPWQVRVSEALTVLPFLFPPAAWGLFVGCFIANILGTGNILDIIFGSLATLLAGLLTARCKRMVLAPLPPVLVNAVVIGLVLGYSSSPENPFPLSFIIGGQILIGEAIACYGLGLPLLHFLKKLDKKLFRS
jgi:uncharacterized membrane protein